MIEIRFYDDRPPIVIYANQTVEGEGDMIDITSNVPVDSSILVEAGVPSFSGGAGGAGGPPSMSPPIDPERKLARKIRRLVSQLAAAMNEAQELQMRISFNVSADASGSYVATTDIVRVID